MSRTRIQPEKRKKQILDQAEQLFLERGYYGVNLDDVAAAAEVVRGTVLHYFGSKEQLYKAVLERRSVQDTELLLTLMQSREQKVTEILKTFVYFCQRSFREAKASTDRCFENPELRYQYDAIRLQTYYRLLDGFEELIERGNEEGVMKVVNPRGRAAAILFGIFGISGESMSTIEVSVELQALIENMLGVRI
ncbi:MAG: TetR/AcrR family transcriptional regulator [Lachnospiraceae bacterium]|nr:TetR/AcrR family transcriptional regulator [Lachnospiraceae bacterium]